MDENYTVLPSHDPWLLHIKWKKMSVLFVYTSFKQLFTVRNVVAA